MENILKKMYRICKSMVDCEDGKKVINKDSVPPIESKRPQMNIRVKEECAKLGRQSEDMKRRIDEEELVPLIRGVASEVLNDFKKQLEEALN
eukprot:1112268-Ditylum_brightwellii.AAC.1